MNREIRYHNAETHRAADEYVLYYLDNDSLDYVKPYMDTMNLYPLRLALLGAEISDGNWDSADSSLAKLPMVTKNDTAIYDLYAMFINLGRDTLSLLDMGSADSTRVWAVASDSTLDASIIAKGMLGVMLDTLFVINPEPFNLPSERRGQEDPVEDNILPPTETKYFKAYPNPFTNSTTIEYDLGKECELGCELRLFDLHGRIILQEILWTENGKGRIVVDMGRYTNGIYYCGLYSQKQLLQTEKLILMR